MTGYAKWDRAAYVDRVGGVEEAERRRTALMARQSGCRLAEERKRRGLTQAQLAEIMRVAPGACQRSSAASSPRSTPSCGTSTRWAADSTSARTSTTTS